MDGVIKPSFSHEVIPLGWSHEVHTWLVLETFRYYSALTDKVIEVEAGFETNLASIPRVAKWIYDNDGDHHDAAIVHDHIYYTRPVWCSRALADAIFKEAMRSRGVGFTKRWTMWAAVRLGGWIAWR